MNILEAQKQLLISIKAGNAVLLSGHSGLGKSSIALGTFEKLKADGAQRGERWGLGTIFAATQTPPDLIGYQFKGERKFEIEKVVGVGEGGIPVKAMQEMNVTITDPSVPLWMLSVPHGRPGDVGYDPGGLPASLYDKFFLIIDEYGQGEADVKRAIAEIFLNGGTAPWYLPPGSVRVGCTNKGIRYGVTKDFDFCISRRTLIEVQGNIDVTLQYMDKPYIRQGRVWQTMPVTKAWAATHPETVFMDPPPEQGPWCMPRTLCDADRYMQAAAEVNGGNIPVDDASFQETMGGIIGVPAAQSLIGHLQFRTQLPAYADVVADPSNAGLPTKADLMMLMAYEMAHMAKPEHLNEVLTYVQRMPKDMQVTFITALLRRDYKGLINQPAMQGWINKNAALVSIIASLSQ